MMNPPHPPSGESLLAQVRSLRVLGLDRTQRRTFLQGEATVYFFPTRSEPAIALIHLVGNRVRNGIISIKDIGGGVGDFLRFRTHSFAVAKTTGAVSLELFGGAFINPSLEALLIRHGFS